MGPNPLRDHLWIIFKKGRQTIRNLRTFPSKFKDVECREATLFCCALGWGLLSPKYPPSHLCPKNVQINSTYLDLWDNIVSNLSQLATNYTKNGNLSFLLQTTYEPLDCNVEIDGVTECSFSVQSIIVDCIFNFHHQSIKIL